MARDFRESAIKCRFMYLLYVSDCTFESVARLTLSRHQLCNPEIGLYSLQEHVWGCMYLFVCVKMTVWHGLGAPGWIHECQLPVVASLYSLFGRCFLRMSFVVVHAMLLLFLSHSCTLE